METVGRRELRKAATRKALHDAARRLFEEHGYEQTTVRDIATAAGVTERTFFRYFPSKEDLVLGEVLDLIPALQDLVRSRPDDEPPYEAALRAVLTLTTSQGRIALMFSGPPRRFADDPARHSRSPVLAQFEDGLADALAERIAKHDTGTRVEIALRAAVLSRAAVGAMRAALTRFSALPEEEQTTETARTLLHTAFAYLKE
ncbi:TetR family transcriptional regulator [Streptomyces sp. GC420]|uniref:TetR family transcriptional regulator n=1 Tax=Streptomyces sp. GC420 TaxID=2697568 RepID=UPI001414EF62|nr:TetR/AcrR family transcriptional regulator [Streptomyces sp. GC420]NBM20011.1 TetR family transcriptional regulator [Streptomyces sp. GC420]